MLAHGPTTTLLDLQRTVGNQAVTGLLAWVAQRSPGSGQVIQRYAVQEIGKAPEARANLPIDEPKQGQFHYAVGQGSAPRWRVSNDGEMAVPDVAETKDFYANDAVATASNAILKAGDSILEFVAPGPSVEVAVPSRPPAVATLKQLKPVNRWNKQESKELNGLALIEHQCFITAHAVLGKRTGIRTQTGQAVFESGPERVVQNVKYETVVPVAEFVTKPSASYSPKAFEKSTAPGPKQADSSPQPVDEMAKQKSVNEAYNHISEQDRKLRSKELGINQFAVPEVGEAIATFSTYLPDTSKWNFHFAGVVAKSGLDFVTLENYTRTSDFRARLVEFAKGIDELFADLRKAEPKVNEKKNDYQKAIAKGREQLDIAAKGLNIPREIGSLEELASFVGKLGDIANEPDQRMAQKELEGALFAVVTVLNRIGGNAKRISNMLETATGADNEDVVKALWYFQMYGPADQNGQDQSFHTEMIKPRSRPGQTVPQSEFEGPVTLRMRSDTSNVAPLDVSLLEIQEPLPPTTGLMSYIVKPAASEQERYKQKQLDYGKNVRRLAAAITTKTDEVMARHQTVVEFEKEFKPVANRGGLESRHALFVNQMIEFGTQQRRLVDAALQVTEQREYKAQFKDDPFGGPLGELATALMLFGEVVAGVGKLK